MKTLEAQVLIIGAGPAGCLAAALLHQQGIEVSVVEKQFFPRFVIGESLLPKCLDLLDRAGLLAAVEAQGFLKKEGVVFLDGMSRRNFDFSQQHTKGWDYAYQVPRAEFDLALANALVSRGVPIRFGHSVNQVEFHPDSAVVQVQDDGGIFYQVRTQHILDCSGFGRVLPRLLDLERPSDLPHREALFAHVQGDIRPAGREEGKIWACIHPQGAWIWIIPFSNGLTSVGVVGTKEFFNKFPGGSESQLADIIASEPHAAARLKGMKYVLGPMSLKGFACKVSRLYGDRFTLVGNATEFLDPIFSSGVTLALGTAERAASLLVRHFKGELVDWEKEYAEYVTGGINVFRTFVTAWYEGSFQDMLFMPDANPDILKKVCSVLAGYVWDESNPFAVNPSRSLRAVLNVVRARSAHQGTVPSC